MEFLDRQLQALWHVLQLWAVTTPTALVVSSWPMVCYLTLWAYRKVFGIVDAEEDSDGAQKA